MTIHATKLHRPHPPRQLDCAPSAAGTLNHALDDGGRLTLISAPAGASKTTLLAAR